MYIFVTLNDIDLIVLIDQPFFFINVSISFPQVSRKVSKCGFLFVAPDFDFSNPLEKTKVNNDVPCACQKSALKINCSWKYKHNAKKKIS